MFSRTTRCRPLSHHTTHESGGSDEINATGLVGAGGGVGGTFGAFQFTVLINGANAEAFDRSGTLIYGGAADAGGVDGADHAAVIQACITAGSGEIHLGNFTFNIGTAISCNVARVTISGEGYDTILNVTAAIDCFNVSATTFMRDFQIDMNGRATNAIDCLAGCEASIFERLFIYDSHGTGIHGAATVRGFRVDKCRIAGSAAYGGTGSGIWLVDDCTDVEISNCVIYGMNYGILMEGKNNRISNHNHIWGNEEGIALAVNNLVQGIDIVDNFIEDNDNNGIYAPDGHTVYDVQIVGNSFEKNDHAAGGGSDISIHTINRGTISANVFLDSAVPTYSIYIAHSSHVAVIGNVWNKSASTGVYSITSVTDTDISHNVNA